MHNVRNGEGGVQQQTRLLKSEHENGGDHVLCEHVDFDKLPYFLGKYGKTGPIRCLKCG